MSTRAQSEPSRRLWLGLPIFRFPAWLGSVYRADARPSEYLAQYAQAFACVEGNSTFYSVPSEDVVARWRDDTPESFRFCFKFPRSITHDALLAGARRDALAFLERMAPLGPRLGPFMLQLPSRFGPSELPVLAELLAALPRDFRYAVELRHPTLFAAGPHAETAREILRAHDTSWIHLDTRSLRAGPQDHPAIVGARHPKPVLPAVPTVTARQPIVRFIGHPELPYNDAGLESWASELAGWLADDLEPFFFVHCPDDLYAPAIARRAHAAFSKELALPAAPPWPGESIPRQLSLW